MRKILPVQLFILLCFPAILQAEFSMELNSGWMFREAGQPSQFQNATVPGCIHTDLLANGRIPDPFLSANESKVQWVETKTWEYQTTFTLTKAQLKEKHIELHFDGVDTYADVYLNDVLLLQCEDMFLTYSLDVKHLVKKTNKLRVVFHPAEQLIARNRNTSAIKTYPGGDRVFIRQAQYQYGWDWGPRLVTCGIWKPVRVRGWSDMRISDVVYKTDFLLKDTAFMTVDFTFEADRGGKYQFLVFQNDSGIYSDFYSVKKNEPEHLKITFRVVHPKLWWCNGMGEAYLYRFSLATFRGKKTCVTSTVTGIRKIEMSNDTRNDGSFTFILNDQPVYVRGSNWIPSDNFLPRVRNAKVASQLSDMQSLNMNMVRVWGGGIYESDYFYSKCDSLGLMVWQDLPFACSMYPYEVLDKNNLLTKEVTQNVRRIFSHPSLAVVCGDNENKEGWYNWGWQKELGYSKEDSTKIYNDYFSYGLKLMECVAKNDPFFPYITTSPQNGWGRDIAYKQGDVHYWGVWWGMEPFSSYEDHTGRFVSEFGFQGAPSLHTFKEMGANVAKWFADSTILNHQKHPTGYQTIETYMKRDYGITPNSFEDYVYLSQVMQKDAMSFAIESQRRNAPACMGSLFWQYNDCWPGTTWSVQDYYGRKKLAWYELKRLYYPELISIQETSDSVFVWVSEHSRWPLKITLYVTYSNFTGTKLVDVALPVEGGVIGSKVYWKESKQKLKEKSPLNESFLYCSLAGQTGSGYPGHISATKLFGKIMDVKFADGDVTFTSFINEDNQQLVLVVTSSVFQSNVMIVSDDPTTTFSDNGFDIRPGTRKLVTVQTRKTEREVVETIHLFTMNQLVRKEKEEAKTELPD
jgi:beta-mannosidase